MKKAILLLSFCSGLIISEVELNPLGTDSGNEWIELFSKSEIDLEEYKLINNDGDEFSLNQIGGFSGYLIIELSKQWLDNEDESYFSWKPCECCGSHLGGDRVDCNGYNPETQEIYEYSVCIDCEYYAEYGQLDDMTMLEIKE